MERVVTYGLIGAGLGYLLKRDLISAALGGGIGVLAFKVAVPSAPQLISSRPSSQSKSAVIGATSDSVDTFWEDVAERHELTDEQLAQVRRAAGMIYYIGGGLMQGAAERVEELADRVASGIPVNAEPFIIPGSSVLE